MSESVKMEFKRNENERMNEKKSVQPHQSVVAYKNKQPLNRTINKIENSLPACLMKEACNSTSQKLGNYKDDIIEFTK